MDEHVIAPRRTLPPVPPAQRPAPGTTLAPPAPAPAAVDETSWYDPEDLLADSLVHTDLGPLAEGSARQAAHDLVRESGRMLVLDEQLLAALDAAAKAAEARRALTAGLVPETPAPPAALAIATPPLAAADEVDEEFDDEFDDEDDELLDDDLLDDDLADEPDLPATAVGIDPATIDVAAEFARHDDLVETRRHPSIDDQPLTGASPLVTDTGRHHLALHDEHDREDDGVPTLGTLSHRTVVTRGSGRRWIPVGVGAGVLSIVAAVLLTSGFGADAAATDEAARTGAVTTEAPAPSTTPTPPAPAMNTLDLSGPVVTGGSSQVDDDAAPSTSPRTGSAVQPQVATPPATAKPSTSGNGSTGNATPVVPATQTAETPTGPGGTGTGNSDTGTTGTSGSGSGSSGTGGSGSGSSDTGTPGTSTTGTGDGSGSTTAPQS